MTDKVTELRDWMKAVMEMRRWSAQRWADTAGISATTITRFLKANSAFVPSTTTINKLSQAAGVEFAAGKPQVSLPIVDCRGLSYNGRHWIVHQKIGDAVVTGLTGDFVCVVDISYATPRIMAADKVVVQRCRVYDMRDGSWAAFFENERIAVARVVAGRMISLDGEPIEQPRPEKVIGHVRQVIADLA
jgi:transcriptional regulator with XRE-family HTH domain